MAQCWKYCAIELTGSHSGVDDIAVLNEAGSEGWELVRITPNNIAYLKRPIEEPAESVFAGRWHFALGRRAVASEYLWETLRHMVGLATADHALGNRGGPPEWTTKPVAFATIPLGPLQVALGGPIPPETERIGTRVYDFSRFCSAMPTV